MSRDPTAAMKMQDVKKADLFAEREIAGHEDA